MDKQLDRDAMANDLRTRLAELARRTAAWRDYVEAALNSARLYEDQQGAWFQANRAARDVTDMVKEIPESRCWTRQLGEDPDLSSEVIELGKQLDRIVLGVTP